MDSKSGEAFVFDVCSFYGHNEYDTANWRAPRHRLSNKAYITAYKHRYPVSEPEVNTNPITDHISRERFTSDQELFRYKNRDS